MREREREREVRERGERDPVRLVWGLHSKKHFEEGMFLWGTRRASPPQVKRGCQPHIPDLVHLAPGLDDPMDSPKFCEA